MKSFIAIVAIAATPLVAAHGNMCDTTQIAQAFPETQLTKCKTDSGFDLTSGTKPSATILAKFCESDTCLSLWKTAMALSIPECSINGVDLIEDILEPAEGAGCKIATSTPSTTTKVTSTPSTSNSTTKTTTAPSSTPSTTTKTPSTTSATPSATAKTPSTTPSATTKTPTASSDASTLTMAAGAIVLVIGAAMF
ncbi:Elicitin-like protein, partial [Globisporangium splendens]